MTEILQLLVVGVSQGCIYGLIALGFVMIYKATEMVNFAQGDIMMLGAFVAYAFSVSVGLGFWLGLLAAICAMAVFGFLVDVVVVRRVMGQPQFSVVILTISLGFIFRAAAGMIWGTAPLNLPTPFGGITMLGGVVVSHDRLAIIIGTIITVLAVWAFTHFSRWGVAMQAASQNQLAAFYAGIPVKFVYSGVWAIAAMISTMAGVLLAPITLLSTVNGFLGIKALAAAVIGGFGSLPGALLGGLIIGIAEPFAATYVAPLKNVIGYLIMFIVLVIRPQGLFATIYQKKL